VFISPYFFFFSGSNLSNGGLPAILLTCSIFVFSTVSGIIRVPQSFSPFLTGIPDGLVAIINPPIELTTRRRFISTISNPSLFAISSIFPSFGSVAYMFLLIQRPASISAASFS
jgi:hypothetical protein